MLESVLFLFALAQPAPAKPAPPTVVLETTMGRIALTLRPDKAPVSTENFLRYVRKGFYDGTIFHRVIPGFMAQAGGFDANMRKKATQPAIVNEAKNGLSNSRATVAMARTNDPDSATSQFFINVADNSRLDYGAAGAGYTVFAEVSEGMDVVDRIMAVPTASKPPHDDVPVTPIVIKTARVQGETAKVTPKP